MAALPRTIAPMLATPGPVPRAHPERWSYELKWDGIRAIVFLPGPGGGRPRVQSRSGRDISAGYPELAGLSEVSGGLPAALDGEIVALDAAGRPSFGRLQRRMNVSGAAAVAAAAAEVAVRYVVFDVVHLSGHDTSDLPYAQRRELLAELPIEPVALAPPVWPGQADAAVEFSRAHGLEGVVSKRIDSPYRPGQRTPFWIKTRRVRAQAVVVGGWRAGAGSRARLGALLMGLPQPDGSLRFCGRVGSGLSDAAIKHLLERMAALAVPDNPFGASLPAPEQRAARFVRPELVAEVEFSEVTADGRLRAPVWRGLRPDLRAEDVVPE